MHIGLFIPCYINQFYPQVAIATLQILEKLNLKVSYPIDQTCCGQPMANSGFEESANNTYQLFIKNFSQYDYVVCPSGSCVYHVRYCFDTIEQTDVVKQLRANTFELCEFLVKILGRDHIPAKFPFKVGLHQTCSGLRGLRLGKSSERNDADYSVVRQLLSNVEGLELIAPSRSDECCGFGGTFAVGEEAVSVKMGADRITDHIDHGAEVLTAVDMSCLMHLEGIIRRRSLPLQIKHVAEILNSDVEQY